MSVVPYSQELIFLISLLGGFFLGLLWDFYRLLRHYFKLGRVALILGDILYCITSLFLGLNIIYNISWGNIRLYIVLAFIIGAILYICFLSDIILSSFIYVIDYIILIIKRVFTLIIKPIHFFIKWLKNLLIPYKIVLKEKIEQNKKRISNRYKGYIKTVEDKKRMRLKKKKIERIIKEQRKVDKKNKKYKKYKRNKK